MAITGLGLPSMFDTQDALSRRMEDDAQLAGRLPLGGGMMYASSMKGDLENRSLMGLASLMGGKGDPMMEKQKAIDSVMQKFGRQPETADDYRKVASMFNEIGQYEFGEKAMAMSASITAAQPKADKPATAIQLFNEAESKKKSKAEELRQTLMLKAYEKTEKLRAEQTAFRKAAAEGGLKYALELLDKDDGYFTSNSLLSNAAKYITTAQDKARAGDTSMIYDTAGNLKPVYTTMMAIAEKETQSISTVDGKPFTVIEKGLQIPRYEPPATTIQSGGKTFTYTGTQDPSTGKLIYLDEAGGQHLLESKGAGK